MDGRTDERTDRRMDRVIPIYPPNFACKGYNKIVKWPFVFNSLLIRLLVFVTFIGWLQIYWHRQCCLNEWAHWEVARGPHAHFVGSTNTMNLCLILSTFTYLFLWVIVYVWALVYCFAWRPTMLLRKPWV